MTGRIIRKYNLLLNFNIYTHIFNIGSTILDIDRNRLSSNKFDNFLIIFTVRTGRILRRNGRIAATYQVHRRGCSL